MLACWVFAAYVAIVNLLALLVVRHDKRVARRRASGRKRGAAGERIPERAFLMLAVMGAGVGGLVGFGVFHHKTRKPRFLVPFLASTLLGAVLVGAWAALLGCTPGHLV